MVKRRSIATPETTAPHLAEITSRKVEGAVVPFTGGAPETVESLSAWITRYLSLAVIGVRSEEVADKIALHLQRVATFYQEAYGHERIRNVLKRDVLAWQRALSDQGLAPATVNNHLASLSGFTTWVHAQAPHLFANGDPAKGISELGLPPLEPRTLSPEQVRALLRSLERMRPSQAYSYVSGAVAAVSEVLGRASQLLETGDGRGALIVLEVVTEEYLAGWELLNDSDGEASDFFRELGAVWTEAPLAADLSAKERRAWIPKLEAWQSELDDYGVDDAFGPALSAAEQGWDYPPLQRVLRGEITEQGAWAGDAPDWADELAEARLSVLERQERFEEYLHLAGMADVLAFRVERHGRHV